MRIKPKNLQGPSSDFMWADFNRVCDANDIGHHPDDRADWWKMYYAGYEYRVAENVAALT